MNASYSGMAVSGRAAFVKLGRLPLAAVAVERELRHDEQAAADIRERAVHFVVFVREYTHFNRFIGQINRIVHGITVCDAEQDKEALSDLSVNPAVDRHRGVRDALNQSRIVFPLFVVSFEFNLLFFCFGIGVPNLGWGSKGETPMVSTLLGLPFPFWETLSADGRLRKQERNGRGFFLPHGIHLFAFRIPYCYIQLGSTLGAA